MLTKVEYPMGTVAFYGADDQMATKVVVTIIMAENAKPRYMKKWYSETQDVRKVQKIQRGILMFLQKHQVKTTISPDRIIGCPHEEGKDYPMHTKCPRCPFWANRDRWTGLIYN
ncbi:hypothetical protein L0128_15625 [candidate division KSB1 bacterium]|nr:hypothetical protein [candidate division KSB1 bacterium]